MNIATDSSTLLLTGDVKSSILIYVILAPVAAAIFSFLGTIVINYLSNKNYKNTYKRDYIETLLLNLNDLLQALDRLRNDAEKSGLFWLTNTGYARTVVDKLRNKVESVIVLSEEGLKRSVVELIDNSGSLIEEIELMERFPVNEQGKLKDRIDQRINDFRRVKVQFISQGIYFDKSDFSKPKYFDKKLMDKAKKEGPERKRLEVIENEFLDISDISKDDERLKEVNKENEKRRSFFVIRILDIQTKIRELIKNLDEIKNS